MPIRAVFGEEKGREVGRAGESRTQRTSEKKTTLKLRECLPEAGKKKKNDLLSAGTGLIRECTSSGPGGGSRCAEGVSW